MGAPSYLPAVVVARRAPRSIRRRCLELAACLAVTVAAVGLAPVSLMALAGPDAASAEVVAAGTLPSPRSRTSAIWANGSAYLFGGRTGLGQGYSNTRQIVRFTPVLGSTVVGQLPPTAQFAGSPDDGREGTAAIWDGTNAYIFGGYDRAFTPLDEIVKFNPGTGQVQVVARLPLPTGDASAVWDGKSAYIFGGYVRRPGEPKSELSSQIVRFTPTAGGGTATTLPQTLPSGRNHTSAVSENQSVVVYGGNTGQGPTDEIVNFAPASGAVSVVGRLPSPRHDTSAVWLPGDSGASASAYVFGGNVSSLDDNSTDETVAHDPRGNEPASVVDRLLGPRAYTSAAASPAGGYVFGGEVNGAALTDQVARFTPTATVAPPAPTPPAPPAPSVAFKRPIHYVGLGDSYSSGEGLGGKKDKNYLGGSRCHRHDAAYPNLFKRSGFEGRPVLLDLFAACSGATTENIINKRQGDEPFAQSQRIALNTGTDLVSITIGGNDAGFSEVLTDCFLTEGCNKPGKVVKKVDQRLATLPAKLTNAFTRIKRAAPNATVVALGYPHVFPTKQGKEPKELKKEQACADESTTIPVPPIAARAASVVRVGWEPQEQDYLNSAGDRLNKMIARTADRTGVYFINVNGSFKFSFTGHAHCEKKKQWVNGVTNKSLGKPICPGPGSFHPNKAGQKGYGNLLYGRLRGFFRSKRRPLTPGGLPRPQLSSVRDVGVSDPPAATVSSSIVCDLDYQPVIAARSVE